MRERSWRAVTTRRPRIYVVYDVPMSTNSKSVIIRTIFLVTLVFNVMNIMDISIVRLLMIAYVIGTHLLVCMRYVVLSVYFPR